MRWGQDNDFMAELDSKNIEGLLVFFILQKLSHERLQAFDLERGIEPIHKMLELAAERRRKARPGSLSMALRRLEREGWLQVDGKSTDASLERFYSLTASGKEQLEAQLANWASALRRFIDEGGLDDSFHRFLNRNS